MSLPWGMKIHPVVAMAQVNLPGPLFLNLALEPSHLRYSARVLKTSHVPTHNTCATKQDTMGTPTFDTQDASETTAGLAPTIFVLLAPLDYPEVL